MRLSLKRLYHPLVQAFTFGGSGLNNIGCIKVGTSVQSGKFATEQSNLGVILDDSPVAGWPLWCLRGSLQRSGMSRRFDQAFRRDAEHVVQLPDHRQRKGSLPVQYLIDPICSADGGCQVCSSQT